MADINQQVKQDILNAEKYFNNPLKDMQESLIDEMATYRRCVAGQFTRQEIGTNFNKPLVVNDFWVNKSVVMPSLYFRRPYVSVNPANGTYTSIDPQTDQPVPVNAKDRATMVEHIMNYYGSSKMLNDELLFSKSIVDDYVCGFGVNYTGWAFERGDSDLKVDYEEVKPDKIDALISQYISPFNLGVDPECTDFTLNDARFIYINYRLPTDYVNRTFGSKLKGSNLPLGIGKVDQPSSDEISLRRNDIKAVWNKEQRKIFWVADENGKQILKVVDWPWQMEGYPITVLMTNSQNDTFHPIPEFRQTRQLILEKIRIHSKLAELLDKLAKVFLCDSTIEKKLNDILSGEEARVIPIDTRKGQQLLENYIKEVIDFKVSNDLLSYLSIIDRAIERVSGIPDYMRGLVGDIRKTATETIKMENQQNLRIEEKKNKISNWILEIYKKRLQLLQQNANKLQIIKITQNDQVRWEPWNKDDIQGDFDFDLDVSTMLAKNKEMKRKLSLEKYDKLRNDPLDNPKKLLEDVHEAYDDNNITERIIEPQPAPPEQKDKPKLSISMKIEPFHLANPQVMELVKQAGLSLSPPTPEANPVNVGAASGNLPTGVLPEKDQSVQQLVGAMRV